MTTAPVGFQTEDTGLPDRGVYDRPPSHVVEAQIPDWGTYVTPQFLDWAWATHGTRVVDTWDHHLVGDGAPVLQTELETLRWALRNTLVGPSRLPAVHQWSHRHVRR